MNPQVLHNPQILQISSRPPVDTEIRRFQLVQTIETCQSLVTTLVDAQAGRQENPQDRPDGALLNFLKLEIDKLSNLL